MPMAFKASANISQLLVLRKLVMACFFAEVEVFQDKKKPAMSGLNEILG